MGRLMMILSIKAVYDYRVMLAREERLGCCHDALSHVDILRLTPVLGLVYGIFLVLLYLKPIHIMFSNVYIL